MSGLFLLCGLTPRLNNSRCENGVNMIPVDNALSQLNKNNAQNAEDHPDLICRREIFFEEKNSH